MAYINKYKGQAGEIGMIFAAIYSIARISENLTLAWSQSLDNYNKRALRIGEGVKSISHELRRLEVESIVPTNIIKSIVTIQIQFTGDQLSNGNKFGEIGPNLFLRIADFIDLKENYSFTKELNTLYNLVSENYTLLAMLNKDNIYAKNEFSELKSTLEKSHLLLKTHVKSLIFDFDDKTTKK